MHDTSAEAPSIFGPPGRGEAVKSDCLWRSSAIIQNDRLMAHCSPTPLQRDHPNVEICKALQTAELRTRPDSVIPRNEGHQQLNRGQPFTLLRTWQFLLKGLSTFAMFYFIPRSSLQSI
jgi:hypothetical protein